MTDILVRQTASCKTLLNKYICRVTSCYCVENRQPTTQEYILHAIWLVFTANESQRSPNIGKFK